MQHVSGRSRDEAAEENEMGIWEQQALFAPK
jgi:hypothetical protein